MSGSLPEITDEQRELLQQFRAKVSDVLKDTHDDYFLLRWLRARKWNQEAAEQMLRASMKTRAMWNADNIEKWTPPRVLTDYLPYGMIGYDKEGSPVLVCPFANFDIWGTLHCVTRFEFQKYLIWLIERFMKLAYEKSRTHGWKARQLVVFFDMSGFNMKPYLWRPATECVLTVVKQYEANFPELLKMCYIVNAPKLFSVAFNFVKKFLDDYTTSKINIYKSGCADRWQEQLFAHVDPDIFPKCWGGNCVDAETGDPKCTTKITWGGKIPEQLFVDQNDDQSGDKKFTEVTVAKGEKLKLSFPIAELTKDKTLISWDFRTIDYDIKFGIYSVDKRTGEKHSEVPLGTVYSNEMDEVGFISTRAHTTYTVVFDNSASYLRSKKLRYWVAFVPDVDSDIGDISSQMAAAQLAE